MSELPERLKDYITVAERVAAFYEKYPDGSLQSEVFELSEDRVVMRAYAYRAPDDERPGVGFSSMPIPASNAMLRNSEIETCETSAWGRALAALGFEVKKAIASRDEIEHKETERDRLPLGAEENPESLVTGFRKVAGKVDVGKQSPIDLRLRQSPDGPFIGFRLIELTRKRLQVVASGTLADVLYEVIEHDPAKLYGQDVTAEGVVAPKKFTDKDGRVITFQRMALERLTTKDWVLPADEAVDEGPEEAESVPAFTEDELAGIEA